MSTLRHDVTTDEWVILAPKRASRPHEDGAGSRPPLPGYDPDCPFCPGNEHMTPPEVMRLPEAGDWRFRVVPNLFAALEPSSASEPQGSAPFRDMAGAGNHEVVVESPTHNARLDEMDAGDVAALLSLWRHRYLELSAQRWTRAVIVFKNFGAAAGASLSHAHSQIVALPVVPPDLVRRYEVAARYHDETRRCVYDDLVREEVSSGERLVATRGRFAAFVPFAGSTPFETWISPTSHLASFGRVAESDLPDLASLLMDVLHALRLAVDDPDFNLLVASSPRGEPDPLFSWHLKIVPRLSPPGGFELGSGMFINTTAAEDAARELRDVFARAPTSSA